MSETVQTRLFPDEGGEKLLVGGGESRQGISRKNRKKKPEGREVNPAEQVLKLIASGVTAHEQLILEAGKNRVDARQAEEVLEKLKLEGLVYSPRHREYRLVQ